MMNTQIEIPDDVGVVVQIHPGACRLRAAGRELTCPLPGDPLVVGDEVRISCRADGSTQIHAVLPRRSLLARRAASPKPDAPARRQAIAANVDLVIPVFAAARPAPHWNLLDRYLAAAEDCDLPALICVTKHDLAAADSDLSAEAQDYRRIGYPVVLTSAASGEGLDELRAALDGRVSVLIGKSGVGKTTLLNALEPGLGLRVGDVGRESGKGRHTTTAPAFAWLAGGGAIVDTPGMREFGLWNVDPAGLDYLFPEMRPFLGRCRFGADCAHDEEPGCAVRRAVMDGQISPRRYQSYLSLWEG